MIDRGLLGTREEELLAKIAVIAQNIPPYCFLTYRNPDDTKETVECFELLAEMEERKDELWYKGQFHTSLYRQVYECYDGIKEGSKRYSLGDKDIPPKRIDC